MEANSGYTPGAEMVTWAALRKEVYSLMKRWDAVEVEIEYWQDEKEDEYHEQSRKCAKLKAAIKKDTKEMKAKLELNELLLQEERKARADEVAKLKKDVETFANESTKLRLALKRQESEKPKIDVEALVKKAQEDAEAAFRKKLKQLNKEVAFWRDRAEHPESSQASSFGGAVQDSKVDCSVKRKPLARKKPSFFDSEPEDSDTEKEEIGELPSSSNTSVRKKKGMTPKAFSRSQRKDFSAAIKNLDLN